MMKKISIIILFFVLLLAATAFAIEPAPKITDREIVESLSEIKATQKAILQRFDQVDKRFEQMDKRIDEVRNDMNSRFEQIDKRIDELRNDMIIRFEQIDKRIDELRNDMIIRFQEMNATNRMFHGFILTLLFTLFGYIIWDRRTLMKPLEEKIIRIEREFDIGAADGSKMVRLINALRELSKEDAKVANVMRQFHLL